MSRTIKAIERHLISPAQPARLATASLSVGERGDTDSPLGELGLHNSERKFVAEWQCGGPETLSGYAFRKLRLAIAPSQSVLVPTPVGAG